MAWTPPAEQLLGTKIDEGIFNDQLVNNLLHLYAGLRDIVIVRDEKSQNTEGGTATSGSWQKRTITEASDINGIASVASSVITLPAGTYVCFISCPSYQPDRHQARLYNNTAAAVLLTGTSEFNANADFIQTRSMILGTFVLSESSALQIEHRVETTQSSDGFGRASNFTTEVYTVGMFWRISQ